MIFVKLYNTRRHVLAVCDSELIGKKFEEGIKILDVRENFYKGDELDIDKAILVMKREAREDATFNIIGEKSVNAAIKAGIASQEQVGKIADIPYVLKLL